MLNAWFRRTAQDSRLPEQGIQHRIAHHGLEAPFHAGLVLLMSPLKGLRTLVIGSGVAGLNAAWWLHQAGCDVEVVEPSPSSGNGGAMIHFYGAGYDVAREMGLLPELEASQAGIERWAFEDRSGLRLQVLEYERVRRRLFGGRHLIMLRADLERILRARVAGVIPVHDDLVVSGVRPYGPRIVASVSDGRAGTYDFVVGAGGIHWAIRRAWFCSDSACERYLGFDSVTVSVMDPELRMGVGGDLRSISAAGSHVTIVPGRGGRVHARFRYRRAEPLGDRSPRSIVSALEVAFAGFGTSVNRIIAAAEYADDLAYEELTQLRLARWSIGGMVLVGDVCHATSMLEGSSDSLAMADGWALARELRRAGGRCFAAFAAYERRMRPMAERAQAAGERMAEWIAPATKLRMMARDVGLRAVAWPVSSRIAGRLIGAGDRVM
jgi:2-polyprenyl-6-methoxyphenol hydroxylase-like FAD-dependent oxidoreductase